MEPLVICPPGSPRPRSHHPRGGHRLHHLETPSPQASAPRNPRQHGTESRCIRRSTERPRSAAARDREQERERTAGPGSREEGTPARSRAWTETDGSEGRHNAVVAEERNRYAAAAIDAGTIDSNSAPTAARTTASCDTPACPHPGRCAAIGPGPRLAPTLTTALRPFLHATRSDAAPRPETCAGPCSASSTATVATPYRTETAASGHAS